MRRRRAPARRRTGPNGFDVEKRTGLNVPADPLTAEKQAGNQQLQTTTQSPTPQSRPDGRRQGEEPE